MSNFDLTGTVALVTGASGGIGSATVQALADAGARVIATAMAQTATVAGAIDYRQLDVTDEHGWAALAAYVDATYRRLDILVNNAGVVLSADVEGTTLEQYRWVNAVMSEGVFLGCKYAIPLMNRNDGGSIINMSSTGALLGYPIFFAYSAAKGAVRSMTKSIAVMCQEKGYKIRCNSVHPGSIETPMVQQAEGRPGHEKTVPVGVLKPGESGAPEDVAAMIVFLASDESRFVTGAEMVVDNGVTIRPF